MIRRAFHVSTKLCMSEAVASVPLTQVNLNLTSPSSTIYENTKVDLVIIPGLIGEYGVTAGHSPILAQMKPGVITVHLERDNNVEKYFTVHMP